MKTFKYIIVLALITGAFNSHGSLITVESSFSQGGFAGGGSISGFFRGTDLNGDGQLSSVSPFVSMLTGAAQSNELEYLELVFTGLGTSLGAQTLIYDKSVADVTAFPNFFFGFAYNIGSSSIGDEDNEGISFSPFAPSTNYVLGALFSNLFITSISGVDPTMFGSCNGINYCAAVLELFPDSNAPDGIVTVSQNLTSARVSVPEPSTIALMFLFLVALTKRHWKTLISGT